MPIITGRRHFVNIFLQPPSLLLYLQKTPVIGGDSTLRDDVPIPRYLYISYFVRMNLCMELSLLLHCMSFCHFH